MEGKTQFWGRGLKVTFRRNTKVAVIARRNVLSISNDTWLYIFPSGERGLLGGSTEIRGKWLGAINVQYGALVMMAATPR